MPNSIDTYPFLDARSIDKGYVYANDNTSYISRREVSPLQERLECFRSGAFFSNIIPNDSDINITETLKIYAFRHKTDFRIIIEGNFKNIQIRLETLKRGEVVAKDMQLGEHQHYFEASIPSDTEELLVAMCEAPRPSREMFVKQLNNLNPTQEFLQDGSLEES